jgi:hypothetical protein
MLSIGRRTKLVSCLECDLHRFAPLPHQSLGKDTEPGAAEAPRRILNYRK